jgi:hypothetical protein
MHGEINNSLKCISLNIFKIALHIVIFIIDVLMILSPMNNIFEL